MKAWIAGAALVAGIFSSSASANGLGLLAQCHAAIKGIEGDMKVNMLSVGSCLGMVEGVRNTMQILDSKLPPDYRTCFPKDGITNEQALRILVKFLEDNPVMLDNNDTFLTMAAYRTAYPCK
jgi:hypothetical protein